MAGLRKGQQLPSVFSVGGDRYALSSISRVFIGKGAPDEIQDVIWLAAQAGLVDARNLAEYVDNNLGVDCGGLVANYYGLGHPSPNKPMDPLATGVKPRYIWGAYPHRKAASDVAVGDAAVFFQDVKGNNPDIAAKKKTDGSGDYDTTTGSQAFHIGLVASVNRNPDGTLTLGIAESSGKDHGGANGAHVRSLTAKPVVAGGLVYCPEGANRIYFSAEPTGASPSMPQW
jgi:hypothetical protein